MGITAKFNVGIVVVFLAIVAGHFAVVTSTIWPKFEEMEAAKSEADHQRVIAVMDSLAGKLRASAQDYAFWDEAYAFANGRNSEAFVASNFSSPLEAFDGLHVNLIAYLDTNQRVLWGKAFDLATRQEVPGIVDEILSSGPTHPHVSGTGASKARSGLVATSLGLMQLAVAPILKNDLSGPPAGTFLIASLLKTSEVQQLAGVTFELKSAVAGATMPAGVDVRNRADAVEVTSAAYDIDRKPVAVLTTQTPHEVTEIGATALRSAGWLVLLGAAAVILALRLFVERIVLSPIRRLKEHFDASRVNGKLTPTSYELEDDEIGELAKTFNAMAVQVGSLRDALSDTAHHANNAYLAGMADWAAGTLHNIRNLLAPINANAWKLQQPFDDVWLKRMNTAIQEINNPETPDERRQKFKDYVIANATAMIANAEKVKSMSQGILTATDGIQSIASEYEKHAQQKMTIDEIDLNALVQDVTKTFFMAHDSLPRLTLPSETAVVLGSTTMLRQVLTNLLLNAEEAMAKNLRERTVRIDLKQFDDRVELAVTDNGHGIAREHLDRVFQRGFSTRKYKRGGLGLHWCLKAADSLGGTLRAESDGPGTGATLVLVLPRAQIENRKAA